jgi:SAM-dependent methyltransferase
MTVRETEFVSALRRGSAIVGISVRSMACLCGLGFSLLSGAPAAYANETANLFSNKNLLKLFESDVSIVHVGGRDTFNITQLGRAAGTTFYQALVQHNPDLAKEASKIWDQIIPKENYGGEYTELQWFATYFTADQQQREKMTADPYTNFFFHYFADNDYANLKEYLKRKYHAADIGDEETYTGQQRKMFLEDLTLFGNPRREEWEKTSAFIKIIDPKPGEVIADVGSGPGYYSFKMAARVGPMGKVYAIDTEEPHVKYVNAAKLAMNVNNVETIQTDGRTIGPLAETADKIVLVSLYHNIYAMTNDDDRQAFLDSIKSKLKDGGHLYLIDNALVPRGSLPYHGPYIAKELVAAQLEHSGFKLEAYYQPIIQRYALVFRYNAPKTSSGK